MSDEWTTPPQYAESRGVNVRKVLWWIETGELQAVNFATKRSGRKRWKLSQESIAAFEQARTNHGKSATPAKRRREKPETGGVVEFF